MTPAIRRFAPADRAQVVRICVAAFEPIHAGFEDVLGPELFAAEYGDWRTRYVETLRVAAADPATRILVADHRGEVAGFVFAILRTGSLVGEIGLNAVDPAGRRRGFGRALHVAALDDLRARGARFATVSTGADAAHAPARAAYAAAGFDSAIPSLQLYRRL